MPLDTLETIEQKLNGLMSAVAGLDRRLTDLKHGQAEWFGPQQVADHLGVSLHLVMGDLRKVLPWKHVGKRLIVRRQAVDEYIERQGAKEAEQLLDSADAIKDMIQIGKVKKQPPDLTAGEFNRREC